MFFLSYSVTFTSLRFNVRTVKWKMDLFEELKIKQKDKVGDSPVETNIAQDLFLTSDERLTEILQAKSSMRIKVDLENPDAKELEAVEKDIVTKLGMLNQ